MLKYLALPMAIMLAGCVSSDFVCNPNVVEPPKDQLIRISESQGVVNSRVRGVETYQNVSIDHAEGMLIPTSDIFVDGRKVSKMKRVGDYTLLFADNPARNGEKTVFLAKGDGKVSIALNERAVDHYQFDYVYYPNTLYNSTDYIFIQDMYDNSKFKKFTKDLVHIEDFQLAHDDVIISASSDDKPSFHDGFMTAIVYHPDTMTKERYVFKYDGKRYQGWVIKNSRVLGISSDESLVYAQLSNTKVNGRNMYDIYAMDSSGVVTPIGSAAYQGVTTPAIPDFIVANQYVSLNGVTIDVLNKKVMENTCSSVGDDHNPYTLATAGDYYICPMVNVNGSNSGFYSRFERYNPATGERSVVDAGRDATILRSNRNLVTLKYKDYGVGSWHMSYPESVLQLNNASDFVE